MDQAPQQNLKDENFLKAFTYTVGTILVILTVYIFSSIIQMF
ncbi:MAG: hypothetical protein OEW58_07375 [Gammaproteobacteria bacterium]|nr:hypothetical protein [Gammaproteobacteria bacterium]